MSWYSREGAPIPLGVTWVHEEAAYNFALYSQHAESVTLLLYGSADAVTPVLTYELDYLRNKSGRIWHCRIPRKAMHRARYYAYSISGSANRNNDSAFCAFDHEKILLDPYATSVFFPDTFDREAAIGPGSNRGKAPLGLLLGDEPPFDWSGEKRPRHDADLIIYEMHVKGFSKRANSGVKESKRGTFAGVVEKIPYLKQLGVTALELMPVFQYDPQEGNYWGYMTLNFFSAHSGYAAADDAHSRRNEFRSMVKALHNAGIEVILDVVYNHTAEGSHTGPTYSFKGIDASTYYLLTDDPQQPYANYSGTGNTLNCADRYVRRMILDSLRYWVREMHVDGFRFDLASAFARNADGSLNWSDPPIFGQIRGDPELGHVRLIAEPWDAGGAYHLGHSFPGSRWFQWNGRFRDDIRRFVRGDQGMVPSLMCRMYGSDDLFPDQREHAYHPYQSVNYVTSHDGFTLYDLVSYNKRHNLANGHENKDGAYDNFSWNCGHEGDGAPQEVQTLRMRQAKNLSCLLLLANGTPMFHAGDEFLQTQLGNNNPYNQDNEITWLDWDRLESNAEFFRFFRQMIAFRKQHPTLCRSRFWRDEIHWYGTGPDVDMSPESRQLAYCLHGASQGDDDLYVMINMGKRDLPFTIQEGRAADWKRVLDTSRKTPSDICPPNRLSSIRSRKYSVESRSIVVLIRSRAGR